MEESPARKPLLEHFSESSPKLLWLVRHRPKLGMPEIVDILSGSWILNVHDMSLKAF